MDPQWVAIIVTAVIAVGSAAFSLYRDSRRSSARWAPVYVTNPDDGHDGLRLTNTGGSDAISVSATLGFDPTHQAYGPYTFPYVATKQGVELTPNSTEPIDDGQKWLTERNLGPLRTKYPKMMFIDVRWRDDRNRKRSARVQL